LKYKILALIPARSGSKGIKNKNIKKLNGKPLINWTIESCLKSKLINHIVVTTDSEEYIKLVNKYKMIKTIFRPKKISKDNSTDYQVINHAIDNLKDIDFDLIVYMRPTTPLRLLKDIDNAIKKFSTSKFSSLRSVHEMSETAYKAYELKKNLLSPLKNMKLSIEKINEPRQNFKKTYVANGVIDIFRKKFIKKNKKLFGNKVLAFQTIQTEEIDNINQFNYISYLLKNK
jgi:CMP-N,N'-diacetyllegionaminic acid synthase